MQTQVGHDTFNIYTLRMIPNNSVPDIHQSNNLSRGQ